MTTIGVSSQPRQRPVDPGEAAVAAEDRQRVVRAEPDLPAGRRDSQHLAERTRLAAGGLRQLREVVAAAEPFDAATLKRLVEEFTQTAAVKPGPASQTLRVAVTGKEVGFGTYETLTIVGKAGCLARVDRALGRG